MGIKWNKPIDIPRFKPEIGTNYLIMFLKDTNGEFEIEEYANHQVMHNRMFKKVKCPETSECGYCRAYGMLYAQNRKAMSDMDDLLKVPFMENRHFSDVDYEKYYENLRESEVQAYMKKQEKQREFFRNSPISESQRHFFCLIACVKLTNSGTMEIDDKTGLPNYELYYWDISELTFTKIAPILEFLDSSRADFVLVKASYPEARHLLESISKVEFESCTDSNILFSSQPVYKKFLTTDAHASDLFHLSKLKPNEFYDICYNSPHYNLSDMTLDFSIWG